MTTALIQVVRRNTLVGLLPLVEMTVERREFESDVYLADRVKREYLSMIDRRIKHEPHVRKILNGENWCIDACVID